MPVINTELFTYQLFTKKWMDFEQHRRKINNEIAGEEVREYLYSIR